MLEVGSKLDNDNTSAGELTAEEFNSLMTEAENVIKPFQTLDGAKTKQMSEVIDIMTKALTYTDVGTANAVQLTRSATASTTEVLFNGMTFMFTPSNVNTGATTLKINTLTAKPIYYNGATLTAGYLNTMTRYIAVYDLANSRFNIYDIATNEKVNLKVSKSGDTMSGPLKILSSSGATLELRKGTGYANLSMGAEDGTNFCAIESKIGGGFNFYTGNGALLSALTIDAIQIANFKKFPTSPAGNPTTAYEFANKQYVDNNTGLGVNQTWQVLTASRANGVTYTNTTGKTIFVVVRDGVTAYNMNISVDGVVVSEATLSGATGRGEVYAIVPNGSTYIMSGAFNVWRELR